MAPITFAHRGARAELPENTIPAFRRALEHGATGLETDAWLSGDGEVVLVHDERPSAWAAFRRLRVDRTPAQRLATPRRPAPRRPLRRAGRATTSCRIDLKAPDVGEPIDRRRPRPGDPHRLWLCSPHARRPRGAARPTRPTCGSCTPSGRTPARRLARAPRRPTSPQRGIDAMNMHHTEWTAGLVALVPPLRRAGVRVGHPGGAPPPRDARHRASTRVYCDQRRPHGRDGRRVEPVALSADAYDMKPMSAIGQIRTKTRPTIDVLVDRTEDARVLRRLAVVAHHEDVALGTTHPGWPSAGAPQPGRDVRVASTVVHVPLGRYGSSRRRPLM